MEITELTTSQKNVVIETLQQLAIELRENNRGKKFVFGMCVPLAWLRRSASVTEEGYLLVVGIIDNELSVKNANLYWLDERFTFYLFCPRDIPPRIEWCQKKIAQLKTELYSL